jgi:sulfopyruvate decarboxylase TPP-binding subunit
MFAEHICLTANEKINDITRRVNDLKEILLGNTAIALGAVTAGVRVAAGYPGTPSTEVLEGVAKYNTDGKISVEWSTNEKAALEVAAGASWSGVRAIVTMKQVGLNVASDPLMSLGVIGTKGGMVIVVADDPGPISSQTEQDTRHFGKFANIPVLDPSSPEEAYEMTKYAFELSEKLHLPIILRPTTKVCHSSCFSSADELSREQTLYLPTYGTCIVHDLSEIKYINYNHPEQPTETFRLPEHLIGECCYWYGSIYTSLYRRNENGEKIQGDSVYEFNMIKNMSFYREGDSIFPARSTFKELLYKGVTSLGDGEIYLLEQSREVYDGSETIKTTYTIVYAWIPIAGSSDAYQLFCELPPAEDYRDYLYMFNSLLNISLR